MNIEQLKLEVTRRLAEYEEYHDKFVTYWEAVSNSSFGSASMPLVLKALGEYLYGHIYDDGDYPTCYDSEAAEEEGYLLGVIDAYRAVLTLIEEGQADEHIRASGQ